MALTLDKIEALAPDQASLDAARKLLKPGGWPLLAFNEIGLIWGECQGSGATPYRVVVSESDAGYKCTCPSRKFPCKHSLALMWLRAEGKVTFVFASVPAWVQDWLSRRRGPNDAVSGTSAAKPSASIADTALSNAEPESDAKTEARALAARERNRQEREASILRGLDDLDIWLSDQIDRGLTAFTAQSYDPCRLIAQRLVDAKASGLATRIEAMQARLFGLHDSARPTAALEELGQVYLIGSAYRNQRRLPPELMADVRQAVGWSITREALLAEPDALRVRGTWRVFATLNEVQTDRLRRLETWLWRETATETDASQRFAVLIDFVPLPTSASASGYSVGDRFDAELVYYPSAVPLRVQIAQSLSGAMATNVRLELPEQDLEAAYRTYQEAMTLLPWLGVWPLAISAACLRRHESQLYLCDCVQQHSAIALPLNPAQNSTAGPLLDLEKLDAVGLWDGYRLTLCWAETELGRWVNA